MAETMGLSGDGARGKAIKSFDLPLPGPSMGSEKYAGYHSGNHPIIGRVQELAAAKRRLKELSTATPESPGEIVRDWAVYRRLAEESPEMANYLLMSAVQNYMSAPWECMQALSRRRVKELTNASDFPAQVLEVIDSYHIGDEEIDDGWLRIYDHRDLSNSGQTGFKITTTTTGLQFKKVAVGNAVNVYPISGEEVDVSFDLFGCAVDWSNWWFEKQQWWTIDEQAKNFRSQWWTSQAATYYGLIEATAANNETWQAAPDGLSSGTAGYQVARDVATLNLAVETILTNTKTSGFNVSPNEIFAVLSPTVKRSRLERALAATYLVPNNVGLQEVAHNMVPIYTQNLDNTDYWYVILPKRRIKAATGMNLRILTDAEIMKFATTTVGWGAYAGAIGDTNQIRRIELS